MAFLDLHCDTASLLLDGRSLLENEGMVSLEGMKQAGVFCQFFALFVRKSDHESWQDGFLHLQRMYDTFMQEINTHKTRVALARSGKEIDRLARHGIASAVLTVEEGGVLDGKLARLETLYQMGVRLVTLTWNYENALGYPHTADSRLMKMGLKPFGCEVVEEMNRLGMLIDVSHLSDGGFWDVAHRSKKPFVASHSNARSLCGHSRNLTDGMLRALAEAGGVTGINFYHRFLGEDETGSLEQMISHIQHIQKVAGLDTIALGSDFDGFTGPCELQRCDQLERLTAALVKAGFTEGAIEKICWRNALRVINEVL